MRRLATLLLVAAGLSALACEVKHSGFFDPFVTGGGGGPVDMTAPAFSGFMPTNGTVLNDVNAMVTVQDPAGSNGATPSGVDPASVTATSEMTSLPVTATGGGMYNTDISGLMDGSYSLQWSARDGAGNTGTATQTFTVDRTAPEVTVDQAPPSSASTDQDQFTWQLGVSIADPHLLSANYHLRFAGSDGQCGTSDDTTPTTDQAPQSDFPLQAGSNMVDVVTNNGVQPGGSPKTAIYCGYVMAEDGAVAKDGTAAHNTTTSSYYRTELTWMAPTSVGGFPTQSDLVGTYSSMLNRTGMSGSCPQPLSGSSNVQVTESGGSVLIANLIPYGTIIGTYDESTGAYSASGQATLSNSYTVFWTLNMNFSIQSGRPIGVDAITFDHNDPSNTHVCHEDYMSTITR